MYRELQRASITNLITFPMLSMQKNKIAASVVVGINTIYYKLVCNIKNKCNSI